MTNVMVVMTTTTKAWAGWWGQGCAVLVATTMTNAPRACSHRQPHLTHEPTSHRYPAGRQTMIMEVAAVGHGAPDPKPPLPPPLPVRAQPELVISRLLVGQTGRIAHRSDPKVVISACREISVGSPGLVPLV